jgi:hypothetical protein
LTALETARSPAAARGALWTAILLGSAFAVPALFAGVLEWPRRLHTLPWVLTVAALALLFARAHAIPWTLGMFHRAGWGLLGAAAAGGFTVWNVLSRPYSSGPGGLERVFDVAWLGLIYGAADAMALTVLPITLVRSDWPLPSRGSWRHAALAWLYGLALSLAVTAAYHSGYPEFRGAALAAPLIGAVVFALSMLLTGSPLAPVLGHIAMHVAAVLYGYDTAVQLPPHY